ncbi:Bacteriophage CI repressor helix-turn-helix domain-containing protein [Humidesulfovibrio mexicanus]|uniref:Bacteriophage CI repressor helix-turn-helix domain-containing protein n=1 Tax=Humidesulfovibrio mexicanus TaxID=147047 RepID=A0A239BDS9_9BACT|nr:helix-turn-helix domain-containing protein [Humidesulfovibrio mexicanus]SNS06165.1 Bacteriophage CI repressor helix-turn-helix domain-containing protein [Humidesulfovibrio mexicanus]
MPKQAREITPERVAAFEAAMERIRTVTGARTQVQLAEALDIRQSSISDAKRRASIPAEWLLKLQRKHQVFADWFLTGEGPRETTGGASARVEELEQELHRVMRETESLSDMIREALVHSRTTLDDLIELKGTSRDMLVQAQKRIKELSSRLRDVDAEVAAQNFTM